MTSHPALPVRFTTLRHFDACTGAGAVAAVFFHPAQAPSQQQGKAGDQQCEGKRDAEGAQNV